MLHEIMANPWRVEDSDNEEEIDQRLYRRITFTPHNPLPNMLARQTVTKIAEWDPMPNEDRRKRKFGRRKTVPSFDKAPTDHKPIFSGTQPVKISPSVREQHEFNKSMIANMPDTPPASPPTDRSIFNPLSFVQENLNAFIYAYIPQCHSSFIQCCLRRDKTGIHKEFYPTFYLHFERPSDRKKTFLMAARKVVRLDRQTEYVISTNIETISDKAGGDGYVGKLRESNLTGTEYTLYDNGKSSKKCKTNDSNCKDGLRRELAGIVYNSNMFGFRGPRQMKVLIPKLGHDVQPTQDQDTILDQWHDRKFDTLVELRNRLPKYSEETKIHMLQYYGNRSVRPSKKNFQIILDHENHQEEVVMQFGRVDEDTFICDYRYPFSAIQAFSIGLSSFDKRFVRD
ncbi:hypothetical protein I4U23_018219 [Adineta vaga]|nr:hypothetical protein I4U23_018219 [Adineta vaga]